MLTKGAHSDTSTSISTEDTLRQLLAALKSAGVPDSAVEAAIADVTGNGHAAASTRNGNTPLELSDNARTVLETRYLLKDDSGNVIEAPEDLIRRVATAVAQGERQDDRQGWEDRFYGLLAGLKFLPNSPTLVNAGTGRGCLSACFVVSPEDTLPSIMESATDAAMIEKWGGGIGFGFSTLRPKTDKISTTHGLACGPVSVMRLYSAVGATLTQGAFRLGAHMGQLRDSHPDVQEFIHCKDGDDAIQNFNISVQVTDDFMRAVQEGADWDLINPRTDQVEKTVPAAELWNEICESAWKTGDPGVVFMDRVWETAPNPQLGRIETSNPCGEEFLENYGNCCLGSINLDRHVIDGDVDWTELERTVRDSVRFLDDVIEVNEFPLSKLREVNLATRRIGLGVMGWADMLLRMNIPYDSQEALSLADRLGEYILQTAWDESARLADERGPYPEFEGSALKQRGMKPVRNSSVVTIAPTGTISRIAGCSSGIEPHFAIAWWSNVLWEDQEGTSQRLLDAPTSVWESLQEKLGDADDVRAVLELVADNPAKAEAILEEHGIDPSSFRTAMGISPEAHVRMQAAWQGHVTNSVSKTINLPNSATIQDVRDSYQLAWELGCKAVTVYRDGSKSMQVLETGSDDDEHADEAQQGSIRVKQARPQQIGGVTERVRSGHGNMYVTVNFDEGSRPFELFANVGKSGGCDSAQTEAITRLVSLALRSGIEPKDIVDEIRGITCCPVWDAGSLVRSGPDGIALVLDRHLQEAARDGAEKLPASGEDVAMQLGLTPSSGPAQAESSANGVEEPTVITGSRCVQCSGRLIHQEGCVRCLDCGYTKCD